jgi:hypothetical protein
MLIKNLKYDGYDTGSYGESRADGITLHFFSEDTSLQYYTIFNVNRTKQRGPSKGSKLMGKRFWITKRFAFYHFWYQTCGLPVPSKGLTTFHDCMGKLSSLNFQAETDDGKRLLKNTLKPIYPDSSLITIRQAPDKSPTISPDKQLQETDSETGFKEILTTCKSNYGISKQGTTDTRIPITPSANTKLVREQSNYEWLAEADAYF